MPLKDGYLLKQLAGRFTLLTIDADAPDEFEEDGISVTRLALSSTDDTTMALKARYLGDAPQASISSARISTWPRAAIHGTKISSALPYAAPRARSNCNERSQPDPEHRQTR